MHRALLPLALLVASSGCIIIVKDGDEPYPDDPTVPVVVDSGMVDCEHSPTPSVLVHVVDEGGAPVTPNELSWSSGGEPPQPAECADESCTTWIAGYDVAGDINVTASVLLASETPGCWWEGSASATVNVLIDDGQASSRRCASRS